MSTGKVVFLGILIVFILVGTFWGGLYLKRYRYSLEKQAVKRSLQYTESKQSMLMQLVGEWYASNDKAQKKYLENRLRLESEKLEDRDVPEDVKIILRRVR